VLIAVSRADGGIGVSLVIGMDSVCDSARGIQGFSAKSGLVSRSRRSTVSTVNERPLAPRVRLMIEASEEDEFVVLEAENDTSAAADLGARFWEESSWE
jgi:hypothetical protein